MDAVQPLHAEEATGDLAIIKDCLRSPLVPDVFGGSFVNLAVDERKRVERPPTALERARARWRSASIAG